MVVDDGIPPERHPSFFNRDEKPASHISALVQKPEYLMTPSAVTLAYMRDQRQLRRPPIAPQ